MNRTAFLSLSIFLRLWLLNMFVACYLLVVSVDFFAAQVFRLVSNIFYLLLIHSVVDTKEAAFDSMKFPLLSSSQTPGITAEQFPTPWNNCWVRPWPASSAKSCLSWHNAWNQGNTFWQRPLCLCLYKSPSILINPSSSPPSSSPPLHSLAFPLDSIWCSLRCFCWLDSWF